MRSRDTTRRTVLRTVGAAAVAGGVATGAAAGGDTGTGGASSHVDVSIEASHDHETGEHAFEFDTTEVNAGWTTLELANTTEHTHFVYLSKLPPAALAGAEADGQTPLEYYVEHVTRPFQYFMDTIDPEREPKAEDLSEKYSTAESLFPGWFSRVLPSGGVGLTSPETTARSTLNLDPGTYVCECYVKNEAGAFHSYHGMTEQLTVTPGRSGPEPTPTATLSVSTDGIDAPTDLAPGENTIAVTFEDQALYDNLVGHDAHLVRVDGGTTLEDLNGWTNWRSPTQFISDGSEPGQFVGGVESILTPALLSGDGSETAYVHVNLLPGDYAWVSEVPDPRSKGLLVEFEGPERRIPSADPGPSRNYGTVGEAPDDDLSERASNSGMSDRLKRVFDRLANFDDPSELD